MDMYDENENAFILSKSNDSKGTAKANINSPEVPLEIIYMKDENENAFILNKASNSKSIVNEFTKLRIRNSNTLINSCIESEINQNIHVNKRKQLKLEAQSSEDKTKIIEPFPSNSSKKLLKSKVKKLNHGQNDASLIIENNYVTDIDCQIESAYIELDAEQFNNKNQTNNLSENIQHHHLDLDDELYLFLPFDVQNKMNPSSSDASEKETKISAYTIKKSVKSISNNKLINKHINDLGKPSTNEDSKNEIMHLLSGKNNAHYLLNKRDIDTKLDKLIQTNYLNVMLDNNVKYDLMENVKIPTTKPPLSSVTHQRINEIMDKQRIVMAESLNDQDKIIDTPDIKSTPQTSPIPSDNDSLKIKLDQNNIITQPFTVMVNVDISNYQDNEPLNLVKQLENTKNYSFDKNNMPLLNNKITNTSIDKTQESEFKSILIPQDEIHTSNVNLSTDHCEPSSKSVFQRKNNDHETDKDCKSVTYSDNEDNKVSEVLTEVEFKLIRLNRLNVGDKIVKYHHIDKYNDINPNIDIIKSPIKPTKICHNYQQKLSQNHDFTYENIFPTEELSEIFEEVKPLHKKAKVQQLPDKYFAYTEKSSSSRSKKPNIHEQNLERSYGRLIKINSFITKMDSQITPSNLLSKDYDNNCGTIVDDNYSLLPDSLEYNNENIFDSIDQHEEDLTDIFLKDQIDCSNSSKISNLHMTTEKKSKLQNINIDSSDTSKLIPDIEALTVSPNTKKRLNQITSPHIRTNSQKLSQYALSNRSNSSKPSIVISSFKVNDDQTRTLKAPITRDLVDSDPISPMCSKQIIKPGNVGGTEVMLSLKPFRRFIIDHKKICHENKILRDHLNLKPKKDNLPLSKLETIRSEKNTDISDNKSIVNENENEDTHMPNKSSNSKNAEEPIEHIGKKHENEDTSMPNKSSNSKSAEEPIENMGKKHEDEDKDKDEPLSDKSSIGILPKEDVIDSKSTATIPRKDSLYSWGYIGNIDLVPPIEANVKDDEISDKIKTNSTISTSDDEKLQLMDNLFDRSSEISNDLLHFKAHNLSTIQSVSISKSESTYEESSSVMKPQKSFETSDHPESSIDKNECESFTVSMESENQNPIKSSLNENTLSDRSNEIKEDCTFYEPKSSPHVKIQNTELISPTEVTKTKIDDLTDKNSQRQEYILFPRSTSSEETSEKLNSLNIINEQKASNEKVNESLKTVEIENELKYRTNIYEPKYNSPQNQLSTPFSEVSNKVSEIIEQQPYLSLIESNMSGPTENNQFPTNSPTTHRKVNPDTLDQNDKNFILNNTIEQSMNDDLESLNTKVNYHHINSTPKIDKLNNAKIDKKQIYVPNIVPTSNYGMKRSKPTVYKSQTKNKNKLRKPKRSTENSKTNIANYHESLMKHENTIKNKSTKLMDSVIVRQMRQWGPLPWETMFVETPHSYKNCMKNPYGYTKIFDESSGNIMYHQNRKLFDNYNNKQSNLDEIFDEDSEELLIPNFCCSKCKRILKTDIQKYRYAD